MDIYWVFKPYKINEIARNEENHTWGSSQATFAFKQVQESLAFVFLLLARTIREYGDLKIVSLKDVFSCNKLLNKDFFHTKRKGKTRTGSEEIEQEKKREPKCSIE